MLDEEHIIQDILRGNKEAFRLLVERYQRPVFRVIYQLVSDSHSVEDIAQETFISAYEKLATHDSDRSEFPTWLFTIARNKSLNHIRKKKWLSGAFDQEAASQANPSEALCTKELFVQLNQVLDRLPGGQRRAFVLAEFENLPYEKIAQMECTSLGTIRSRIFRAKQKLREAMEQISGEEQ